MSLLLQIPLNVGSEVQQLAQSEFFVFTIPFLLTFAIVYGILGHVDVPEDNQIRAVISLILGLLVLPTAPALMGFLQPLTGSLMLLIGGLLVFIILLELLGLTTEHQHGAQTPSGQPVKGEEGKAPLFERHGSSFAVILVIIAGFIFVNSGGLELLGIQTPSVFLNTPLLFFLVVMFLVVWFVSLKE